MFILYHRNSEIFVINCFMIMNRLFKYICLAFFVTSCASEPKDAEPINKKAMIFPDYTDLTIPVNIAPLNFMIQNDAEEYFVKISGEKGPAMTFTEDVVDIPIKKWRKLLEDNVGCDITFHIYTRSGEKWVSYVPLKNRVSKDKIDSYLVYRSIPPSYTLWKEMGIYERSLESFDLRTIHETTQKNRDCMNCHSFQAGNGDKFMLHTRPNQFAENTPGTIIVNGSEVSKVNTKTPDAYGFATYPAWHPLLDLIAFSTNATHQEFHMSDNQKVEVLDSRSDLILYDIKAKKRTWIINSSDKLETFPAWSPDGRYLYYCVAESPVAPRFSDSQFTHDITMAYDKFKYDVMRIEFDAKTGKFSEPEMVIDAKSIDKSASHPSVSPDGKFLLVTLSDFGQFSIWHKSSDLYLLNLSTKELRELSGVNSDDVDSYHTWSSNGRWFTFASRRDDGSFGRPYFSHVDELGNATKPFVLPQKDVDYYLNCFTSFNIPELIKSPVNTTKLKMAELSYQKAQPIK